MSRIGQAIINIPNGVEVKKVDNKFFVKSSKGELSAPLNETVEGYMSDVEALADHHISITPLHLDLTHHKSLSDLKKGLKTDLN